MNQSRKEVDETMIELQETKRQNGEIQRTGEEELEKASNSFWLLKRVIAHSGI